MLLQSTMLANSLVFLLTRLRKNHIRYASRLIDLLVITTIIIRGLKKVQLQTLTAVVKLFLKKPDTSQGIVQRVLNTATKDCESPDVRDRAYIYWRLLSMDPAAAKVRSGGVFFVNMTNFYVISGCCSFTSTTNLYSSDDGGAGAIGGPPG